MVKNHRVKVTGPLGPYADGLWEDLLARGYSPDSSRNILRAIAHLSRWASKHGVSVKRLRPGDLDRFFASRRRAGYAAFICSRSLDAALGPLESLGAIRWVKQKFTRPNAFERLFDAYALYLRTERGIGIGPEKGYSTIGRRFLSKSWSAPRLDLQRIGADDITSFILEESRRYSIGTAKYAVTALRSLLLFLFLRGETTHNLATAVPAVAGWRLSGLPKAFDALQVKQLLDSCDRRSWDGRRDYAVLLLMTRLGLRVGEVARLSLDDIDWTCGELVIHGKGRRHDRLPLPPDVGAALARHLSKREPGSKERAVFMRQRAPRRGISVGGIQRIVSASLTRVGLPAGNAHRLRHTTATQILRHGGSLDDIAQVLRHKSHDTTAIYAKVDLHALAGVARHWPRGGK